MENNTPLDAQFDFQPSEEDRPAGVWMEGHWSQIGIWAKRFAFALWGYLCFYLYSTLKLAHLDTELINLAPYLVISLSTWGIPLILLSFFCFRMGQSFEHAVLSSDQFRIERAFRFLRYFLITSLVVASIATLSFAADRYNSYLQNQAQQEYLDEYEDADLLEEESENESELDEN